jgi:hypothetical protein
MIVNKKDFENKLRELGYNTGDIVNISLSVKEKGIYDNGIISVIPDLEGELYSINVIN